MKTRKYTHRCRLLGVLLASALVLAGCNRGANEAELLVSAQTFLEKQDYAAAVIQLKSALQKNPQNSQARLMLGQALLDSGDATAAAIELRKALELGAIPTQAQPPLARALLAQNQPQLVLEQFAAVKLDSTEASAHLKTTVATAYFALRQRDKALEAVLSALQDSPQLPAAILLHARIKGIDGDVAGALALVDEVLAINASFLDAMLFKGELQHHGLRDRESALATYIQAAETHPKAMAPNVGVINVLLEQRDIDKARTRFEQLKNTHPSHPETLLLEAQFAYADGKFARARELTEQLMRAYPENIRVVQLAGATELRLNSLTRAEAHLARVMKTVPQAILPRQLLARIYIRTGQPLKALDVLRPLIDSPTADSESLTLAGEALLQTGDLERAEAAFSRAARINPQSTIARAAVALGQVARGDTAAGFDELEAVAAADTGTRANLALIAARLRRNDIPAALKAIDDLEQKQPSSPVAHTLRASILLQQKDVAGATASFEKALGIDPLFYPATAGLASIDVSTGRTQAAQERFENLLRANPRNTSALLALAQLKARSGGSKDEITAAITRAARADPQEPGPRVLLINHLLGHRDYRSALTAAQEAASALPENVDVMNALGSAQLAVGDLQQALATFGRAVAIQPTLLRSSILLAEAYLAAKDYAKAKQTLRRVLEMDPRNLPAQRALIGAAMSDKRSADALAVARLVQKQRPQELVGYLVEAEIHVSQQRNDLALVALKTAFERRQKTDTVISYHSLLQHADRLPEADRLAASWRQRHPKDMEFVAYLGSAAMKRNEFAQAEQLFRTALEPSPNDGATLNNLAYALVRQRKPDSLTYAMRANELMPESPPVMDTLAAALGLANRLPEALQLQRKAVSLSKNEPLYRLHLADLLIQSGDRDAARTELEGLRRLGGRFDQQAEVTALLARL